MKSRSRCFVLLGLIMNSGCAILQPVKASVDIRVVRTIQGYSVSRNATATSGVGEIAPGVIGGWTGAIVGGALGFLWAQAHCEAGISCNPGRPVLTAAAVGAMLGLFVEWVVRSGPQPAPDR